MRTFWNSCWLGVLFANGEQNAINISKPGLCKFQCSNLMFFSKNKMNRKCTDRYKNKKLILISCQKWKWN